MTRWLSPLVLLACIGTFADRPQAADLPPVSLKEWKVPWEKTRPRDPFAASEDRVWFVGQRGNYVAYLNPQDGTFKRFELPDGALPHNLIVDQDGYVWYAGNGDAHIGRVDPNTGAVERIEMPDVTARDPHTLVFDHDGNIWFTVQGGNFIGHLDTKTRAVRLAKVPTEDARPYGIKINSQNKPWVVAFGSNKLLTVEPSTMAVTEVTIPREDARPRRIEITADDTIWYVDYADGYVGHYDPKTKAFEEWQSPSGGGAQPYGTALDEKGRIWFVEFGTKPARFFGFDTKTKSFVSRTDIPSGGGVRHMHYFAPTQTVWFGTDSETIGRIETR